MEETLRLSQTYEIVNLRTVVRKDEEGYYYIDHYVVTRPGYKGSAYKDNIKHDVFGKMDEAMFNTWLLKTLHNASCTGASKSEQNWMKEVNQTF